MDIDTSMFGNIEIEEDKIIVFEKGLPGLEDLHKFIFLTPENTYPLYFLQSLDDASIALPVVNPFLIIENYNPLISEEILDELEVLDIQDVLILNVTVIPEELKNMTVNLLAPILINISNFKGRQVVLDTNDYSIRYPMYEKFAQIRDGGDVHASSVSEEK